MSNRGTKRARNGAGAQGSCTLVRHLLPADVSAVVQELAPAGSTALSSQGVDAMADVMVKKFAEASLVKVVARLTVKMVDGVASKVAGDVTDKVVNAVADQVADDVMDAVTFKVADVVTDAVTDKVADKVADKVEHKIADQVSATPDLLVDRFWQDERVRTIVLEPIFAALHDAVVFVNESSPQPQALANAVAAPVVAAVAKANAQPVLPLVVLYTEMSMEMLRAEFNRIAPGSLIKPIDIEVLNQRNPMASAVHWDVMTILCCKTRRGPGSNPFTAKGLDHMTITTMKTAKNKVMASGVVPKVFRDWAVIMVTDGSLRHLAFCGHINARRPDYRTRFRRYLQAEVLDPCENRDQTGEDIVMRFPAAVEPPAQVAAGHDFFSYERSMIVCETGVLLPVATHQRTAVYVKRGCLVTFADDLLNQYSRSQHRWSSATLVAVAKSLRGIFKGQSFDWTKDVPEDNVGTRTTGPCCWRFLQPRLSTRVKVAKEVRRMSASNMDIIDAGLGDEALEMDEIVDMEEDEFDLDEK